MDKYVLVPIDVKKDLPITDRGYLVSCGLGMDKMYVRLAKHDPFLGKWVYIETYYHNEGPENVTHWYKEKPIEEVIKERMPTEELYNAIREFMITVNLRFPLVSVDDPKSMACYEAYHKLDKLLK